MKNLKVTKIPKVAIFDNKDIMYSKDSSNPDGNQYEENIWDEARKIETIGERSREQTLGHPGDSN